MSAPACRNRNFFGSGAEAYWQAFVSASAALACIDYLLGVWGNISCYVLIKHTRTMGPP